MVRTPFMLSFYKSPTYILIKFNYARPSFKYTTLVPSERYVYRKQSCPLS